MTFILVSLTQACSADDGVNPSYYGDDNGALDPLGGDPQSGDSDLAPGDSVPADSEVLLDPPPGPADYVIVTTDALQQAARRYQTYRIQTGLRAHIVTTSSLYAPSASHAVASNAIATYIASLYAARTPQRPFYVLLLGDGELDESTGVPARYSEYSDNALGQLFVASDHAYADVNDDGFADFAIGRIPSSTPADVAVALANVKAYEAGYKPGPWNKRINLFASTAGFGDVLDDIIENAAFQIVESVSYDFDVTMTYGKQESPYVFVPERFSEQVYERINEGAVMLAYIGHGWYDGFASLQWNNYSFPLLDVSNLTPIDIRERPPILAFVACATGAFHLSHSVSERILAEPSAPPVVISSTEVSHPIPNAIFIYELGKVLTEEQPETIGKAFVRTKERMLTNNDAMRQQISLAGTLLVGTQGFGELIDLHLDLYTLFGDPAMVLTSTEQTSVTLATSQAKRGDSVLVTGTFGTVVDGEVTVTLESKRSTILGALTPVPEDGYLQRDSVIEANYFTANDKVVLVQTAPVTNATYSVSLTIPDQLPLGDYHVKVFAENNWYDARGSAPLRVVP